MKLQITNKKAETYSIPLNIIKDNCCEGTIQVIPSENLLIVADTFDIEYYVTDDKSLITRYDLSKRFDLNTTPIFFVIEYGGMCVIDENCITGELEMNSECEINNDMLELEICIL